MTRQNRNTLLFLGFLLLAGLSYYFTRTGSTVQRTLLFLVNFMIYAGLLLFWMQPRVTVDAGLYYKFPIGLKNDYRKSLGNGCR